jgi:hypothetical protein
MDQECSCYYALTLTDAVWGDDSSGALRTVRGSKALKLRRRFDGIEDTVLGWKVTFPEALDSSVMRNYFEPN